MTTVIDALYNDLSDAESAAANESPSLGIALADVSRKYFVIAAASYFEIRVTVNLLTAFELLCSKPSLVVGFVELQALKRKYHTLFDWNNRKANSFFSLFGQDFKKHMDKIVQSDTKFQKSISDFIEIGSYRNSLAHADCTSFQFDKTLKELYDLYKSATYFVEEFSIHIIDYNPQQFSADE